MTKIICQAHDCIFWENKLCTSEEIVYDPGEGCLTYEVLDDELVDLEMDDDWDEEEIEGFDLDDETIDDATLDWDDDDLSLADDDLTPLDPSW